MRNGIDQAPPRRGRPPSRKARDKALAAARAILSDDGFGRVTMDAVAARSSVGKPTLYRHWANAQELTLEALLGAAPDAAPPDGDLRGALTGQLERIVAAFATTRGRQIAQALATADPDSELTRAFRGRVILDARAAGATLIGAAIDAGRLVEPPDRDTLLDMIYGPVLFRLLTGHAPLTPSFPAALVDTALRAIAPRRGDG